MKKLINKVKVAEITVDTIDFIEKQIHKVTQENSEKEILIDQVIEMLGDHYHTETHNNHLLKII